MAAKTTHGATEAGAAGRSPVRRAPRRHLPETLGHLAVPIGDLRPYGRNPRRGDVRVIRESLERHGQYRPVVVNRRTMEVLAGNHTLAAALALGWTELAATFVDVDEDQARRIVLVDNRSNDLAGYDSGLLAELLQELPDLDGTGYDMASLDALLEELGQLTLGDEDEPPAPPAKPRTRPGDLIELGRHRLVCGDATDPDAYARLLDGEQAQLLWTDPPYGVSYTGKTEQRLTIANDGAAGLAALLEAAFAQADLALAPGAALYVAHPAGGLSLTFGNASDNGF